MGTAKRIGECRRIAQDGGVDRGRGRKSLTVALWLQAPWWNFVDGNFLTADFSALNILAMAIAKKLTPVKVLSRPLDNVGWTPRGSIRRCEYVASVL
jgi:hypothetical protein